MSVPPDTVLPQRSLKPWLIAFAGLGILVRLVRYCLRSPFTGDEARLVANLVSRSYAGLTQTLEFNQVAPLPFLWLERAMMSWFGFSELSFRLPLVVAGILSVALFVLVARRLLDGAAAVLAVAVWAVAHFPIRYSAEIKPYGLDALVSLGLLALAAQWWRERSCARWLWALAAVTLVALAVSFPAVFVAGALSAALAWPVWRDGTVRVRIAFAVFVAAMVGAFLLLLQLVIQTQYRGVQRDMLQHWNDAFPPILHPWQLLLWLGRTFSGEVMGYPFGASSGGGLPGFLAMSWGLVVLARTPSRWLALTTVWMIFLGLMAAAAQRYPFAGHPKLTQYLAPAICLSIGAGLADALSRFRQPSWRDRAERAVLASLFGAGVIAMCWGAARPYKGWNDEVHRGFARWFWSQRPGLPVVCVDLDQRRQLYEGPPDPLYICYRAEYSTSRRRAANGPVRYVFFHMENAPRRQDAYNAWLAEITADHALIEHTSYRVPAVLGERGTRGVYEEFIFAPRAGPG